MAKSNSKSTASRNLRRRLLSGAGLALACFTLASPVSAGDPSGTAQTLQVIGDLGQVGDVAGTAVGVPGLGNIISMVGDFAAGLPLGDDPTTIEVGQLSDRVTRLENNFTILSGKVSDLQAEQDQGALATAQSWDAQTMNDLTAKSDTLRHSTLEVLRPLTATPAAEIDEIPPGAPAIGPTPYGNRYHLAASGVARATVGEADEFLDLRYLPYGGGCTNGGGSDADSIINECVPNQLWVVSKVVHAKVPDRDSEGLLRSYGMVDGQEVVAEYKFRPELALPVYFAELRVAVAAMEVDLRGQDMAVANPGAALDPARYRYFQTTYGHLFDKHIAFLTYITAPPDPSPDGLGSTDYHRYVTHTNTSLSDAYYIAMRRGEDGMNPATWRAIDKMRSLLSYAKVHGTTRGWTYSEPTYITDATGVSHPPAGHTSFNPGQGPRQFAAAQPDQTDSFLLGLDRQGGLYQIEMRYDAVNQSIQTSDAPFASAPGAIAVDSLGDQKVLGWTSSDLLLGSTAGGGLSPIPGGAAFVAQMQGPTFAGGNGVFYTIQPSGALVWSQVSPSGALVASRTVGSGWAGFRQVVGAGQGVIYVVNQSGDLIWFRHTGYLDGAVTWAGPIKIGSGWNMYARIVAAENGVIIGVKADGSAYYYHHREFLTGLTMKTQVIAGGLAPVQVQIPDIEVTGPFPLAGSNLAQFTYLTGRLSTLGGNGQIR